MAEYSARCAARDTRRAVSRVHKALVELRACAAHWMDLDSCIQSRLERIDGTTPELEALKAELDELFPPKRGPEARRA